MSRYRFRPRSLCCMTCFSILVAAVVLPAAAQVPPDPQDAIATYEKNRAAFVDHQRELSDRFRRAVAEIQQDVATQQKQVADLRRELEGLDWEIGRRQAALAVLTSIQAGVAFFLFPLATLGFQAVSVLVGGWGGAGVLLSVFLSLLTFNLFIFLAVQRREVFRKHRIVLIIALVAFILALTLPALAEDDLSRHEALIDRLGFAEKVLSLSDYERFIAILESKVSETIDLPNLATGDPLLTVHRKVRVDSPEYYSTLAALYMHEKKTGKAVDAVGKIVELGGAGPGRVPDRMAIDAIQFLIRQRQSEMAGRAVDTLAGNIGQVSDLLQLAKFLRENGMQTSEEKVLGYAIQKADTVQDLVELSGFLVNSGESLKGTEALEQALGRVRSVEEMILVAKAALQFDMDPIVEQVARKTQMISSYRDKLSIADLFMENGRKEDALAVFSEMIELVRGQTPDKVDKLLFIVDAALQREFINQAVKATQLLFLYLGEGKNDYRMAAGSRLASAKGLPDPDKVTLPQFYGLLNEELDYHDKAEEQYVQNVNASLTRILQSYGYEFPESLNDYHLLGRIWVRQNRPDHLVHLDRVYTIIEEHFLKQQAILSESQLQGLRRQKDEAAAERARLQSAIQARASQVQGLERKLAFQTVFVVAVLVLLGAILTACVVLSIRYARQLARHRTFAFLTRFVELTGWVRVMSILGVVTGLVHVLVAQLFQILQMTQDNTHRLALAHEVAAAPPQATLPLQLENPAPIPESEEVSA